MASARSKERQRTKDSYFFFKDNSHYCRVKNKLFNMFQTGEFSDVTIMVKGKQFQCHKNILSASSPYFKAMFSCGLKENTQKEIKIENVDHNVFYDVVRYLYNGELNITRENAQSLLECADMMQLEELKFGCSQYFEKYLSSCNCFGIWMLANRVNDSRLHRAAWDFALQKFTEVIDEDEFRHLDVDSLKCYLGDPKLNVASEEKVCDTALKWLKLNPDHNDKDVEDILSSLRLNNLDVVYIKTQLLTNKAVQKNLQVVDMLQGMLDHLLYNFPLPYSVPVLMPRLHTAMRTGIMVFGGYDKNSGGPHFVEDCHFVKHTSDNKVCVTNTTTIPACYWEGVAACVVDGVVYISGLGGPSFTNHNEVFKYEVSTDEWLACSNMNTGRLWHAMIRGYKDKIYVLGGLPDDDEHRNGVTNVLCQVEEYIIERNVWEKTGKLSIPVYTCSAVFHRGVIYTFGGCTHQQTKCKSKAIQAYDTGTNHCSLLEWELPLPSAELSPVSFKNWAILLGSEHCYTVDLEKLSTERQTFPTEDVREEDCFIRKAPGIGFADFGAQLLGDQVFLLGGVSGVGERAIVRKDVKIANVTEFIGNTNEDIEWRVAGSFDKPYGIYTTAVVKLFTDRHQSIV